MRTLSREAVERISYPVKTRSGWELGISFLEALPLVVSCDRLIAAINDGSVVWEADEPAGDLALEFAGGSLILNGAPDDDGESVEFLGRRASGVRAIELRADLLDSTELEVWASWEGVRELKAEIARFAEMHGCSIRTTEVPDIRTKLITVLRGGGRLPDLVMVQSDYLPALVGARALQPLPLTLSRGVVDKGTQAMSLDGTLWAAPFYFDAQLVFANKGAIPQPIPEDWTLSDFEGIASDLAGRGWIPAAWNAYSAYWLVPFQFGFGKKSILEADGSIRIDDDATHRAVQYLADLQDRGLLAVLERDAMISLYVDGKIGMILSGSYSIPRLRELGPDFQIAPFPVNAETGKPLAPLLDFKGLAVARRSRNPLLALRLVQHLTGVGVQGRFPLSVAKLPANDEARELMRGEYPYYRALEASYDRGVAVPASHSYEIFKNTMWKLLRLVLSDQLTVHEALTKGQEVLDANQAVRQR